MLEAPYPDEHDSTSPRHEEERATHMSKTRHLLKFDSTCVRYVETHTLPVSKTRHPINPSQATKLRSVGHTAINPNPACRRHATITT